MQFVLILFSLESYLLFPFVRRYIYQMSATMHIVLTAAMFLCSLVLIANLSFALTIAYCLVVGFVSLVCPLFLVKLHKFKAKINGPWDQAVPNISLEITSERK